MTLRKWLCRWLCCGEPEPAVIDVPTEVREASHRMSTAVANVQGIAFRLNREVDALNDLVTLMQDGPEESRRRVEAE